MIVANENQEKEMRMSNKLRILVVDDESDHRSILAYVLEKHYDVITAENGQDAVNKLNRAEPDLILADIKMPNLNGYELAEYLRDHPRFNSIPLIFLSAMDYSNAIRAGYQKGASFYMTKPIDPSRLLRNLDYEVKKHGLHAREKRYRAEEV